MEMNQINDLELIDICASQCMSLVTVLLYFCCSWLKSE